MPDLPSLSILLADDEAMRGKYVSALGRDLRYRKPRYPASLVSAHANPNDEWAHKNNAPTIRPGALYT